MKEIIIKNKQQYLNDNYPFVDIPKLTDKKLCIHCDNIITVGDFKVFRNGNGTELIYCPKAPDCNGTLIDWIDLKRKNRSRKNL